MGIKESILSADQKAMENAVQSEREAQFADGLVKAIDLPSNIADVIDEELRSTPQEKRQKAEEEKVEQEEQAEEDQEEVKEETSEESEEESSEEDLVPRSKVQKRIDELTRDKAILESRLRRLEEKSVSQETPSDSDMARLEKMSDEELRHVKKQINIAKVKSMNDEAQLSQLVDLEEKVETALRSAPNRFQSTQVGQFNKTWEEVSGIEGKQFTPEFQKKLFAEANHIYARSNALKRDVSGQAEALWAAYDKLSAVRNFTEGKSKATDLERQVNTLKKKISVDSSSKKSSSQDSDSTQKLFYKAKNGDSRAKTEYFKKIINIDNLVTDEDQRYYK